MEYLNALSQGILWGIMGIGLYISFRILNVSDLTSEASFTLGGATAVSLIVNCDVHPLLATIIAFFAGMLAGLATGILITVFEITPLLAGIITMTALYSVNLRIMGKPNLSTRGFDDVFDFFSFLSEDVTINRTLVGLIFVIVIVAFLIYFFRTDRGQAIIATGDNEIMVKSLGISANHMKCIALMMANGLIALSGALVAQDNSFADISNGSGTIVIAFSSIVIGEVLVRNTTLPVRLITVVIGAMIYRCLLVFVLNLGFSSTDFKFVSALVLAIFLAYPAVKRRIEERQSEKAGA